MTDVVNHVNFEKCTLPKRDEAINIRKENAENIFIILTSQKCLISLQISLR